MKILNSQKHVFWEALLITLVIFTLGITIGVVLENWRANKIDYLYRQSEVVLLDIRAQGEISSLSNLNCETSIQETLSFADRIFEEAEVLTRYEAAERLTEEMQLEHKKYDVLRALLWADSVQVKKKCKADFHTIVYIYGYENPDADMKAKQRVFSRVLSELKEKRGGEIVLIPMAGDNGLSSVSLMMGRYNVSESELPVILINEKIKVTEVTGVDEISKLIR